LEHHQGIAGWLDLVEGISAFDSKILFKNIFLGRETLCTKYEF
jgi:hypothetical protein